MPMPNNLTDREYEVFEEGSDGTICIRAVIVE